MVQKTRTLSVLAIVVANSSIVLRRSPSISLSRPGHGRRYRSHKRKTVVGTGSDALEHALNVTDPSGVVRLFEVQYTASDTRNAIICGSALASAWASRTACRSAHFRKVVIEDHQSSHAPSVLRTSRGRDFTNVSAAWRCARAARPASALPHGATSCCSGFLQERPWCWREFSHRYRQRRRVACRLGILLRRR
jgi:hypothetical protein